MSLLGRSCGGAGACGLERQPGAAQGRAICDGHPPPAPSPTHRAGGARGRELPPWQRVRSTLQVDPLAYLHGLGRLAPTARCVERGGGGASALLGGAVSSARSLSLPHARHIAHCLHKMTQLPIDCTLPHPAPYRAPSALQALLAAASAQAPAAHAVHAVRAAPGPGRAAVRRPAGGARRHAGTCAGRGAVQPDAGHGGGRANLWWVEHWWVCQRAGW